MIQSADDCVYLKISYERTIRRGLTLPPHYFHHHAHIPHVNSRVKMALSLDLQNRVLYACSCSQLSPLCDLYFCRHCKVPRCQDCVFSTVESFSCPHCFEACSVSTELKAKKGRCNHCFQCPQCASTLTTRSVLVPTEVLSQGEQQSPKDSTPSVAQQTPPRSTLNVSSSLKSPGGTKLYFLSCSHCKWSTRDVKIEDKRSPVDFKDKVSPHLARFTKLVSFYKEYAHQDVAEREKAKKPPTTRRPRAYGGLLDPSKFKFSLTGGGESPLAKRRGSSQITWDSELVEKMKAETTDPSPPPDEFYTEPLNLAQTPSIKFRLMDPVIQSASSAHFSPRQLFLISKKLHRCNGCDHILIKAEMNPGSIRFKIQQIAWHVFPHVRIMENPCFEAGQESEVCLSISNPVNYPMTISFKECAADIISKVKETITPCSLPAGEFVLTPNDDVGDLLDEEDEIKDDPQFVHSRLPGKLVLKFRVTPENVTESVKLMFLMEFSHKPMIETDQNNAESVIRVPVVVRLLKCK